MQLQNTSCTAVKNKNKKEINMTYSSALAVNRQQYIKKNQNSTIHKHQKHRIGPVTNTVLLVVMSCLVGLLYLSQVSKTNSYGYRIEALKKEASSLKEQKNDLEIEAARLMSLDREKNSTTSSGLVSVVPNVTLQN